MIKYKQCDRTEILHCLLVTQHPLLDQGSLLLGAIQKHLCSNINKEI